MQKYKNDLIEVLIVEILLLDRYFRTKISKLGMVVHAYNLSTQRVDAGKSWNWSQSGLHSGMLSTN